MCASLKQEQDFLGYYIIYYLSLLELTICWLSITDRNIYVKIIYSNSKYIKQSSFFGFFLALVVMATQASVLS